MDLKVFLFVGILVFLVVAEKPRPFKNIVSHLQDYSSVTGGFTLNKQDLSSLEATYYALSIAALHGSARQLVNQNEATLVPFLETLQNGDFGYGRRPGVASDLISARHAVFSYQLMGHRTPDEDKLSIYVRSLQNQTSGLFSNRMGEDDSVQATAYALEILSALNQLDASEKFPSLQSFLKSSNVGSYFNFDSDNLAELTDNYYGLVIASLIGYKIDSPSKWATYILSKQNKATGGFDSFDETLSAVASLRILGKLAKESLVDKLDLDGLVQYAQTATDNLAELAKAHISVALTKKFTESFEISSFYLSGGKRVKGNVVQGAQLKPALSVKNQNGLPHSGLDVEATVSHARSQLLETDLPFSESEKHYVSENHVDTATKLGSLSVKFTVGFKFPGYGEISFEVQDDRKIGYGIVVAPKVTSEGSSKDIQQGDTVSVGTNFVFTVTLHNQTEQNLLSGDFAVNFVFFDSSHATVFKSTKEGKGNSGPFVFEYKLKSSSIPAGHLSFNFQVSNKEGVHTEHSIQYLFNVPMIASKITFDRASTQYKVGEKVRVTIVPANYQDLRTLHALEVKDSNGNDISEARSFHLDVHSHQGQLLKSVKGTPSKGSEAKYSFEIEVENSLDFVGNHVLTFRYHPTSGSDIPLLNYDQHFGELYPDSFLLNFTVSAELHLTNLRATVAAELFYGNEVDFKFNIQDALTKKLVKAGKRGNVFLLLQHKDEERSKAFTSSTQPAVQVGDGFSLTFTVDPNAIQGPGILALIAQGADENQIPLYKEGSKKEEIKYDVTVGGKIDVEPQTFTQASTTSKLASLFHETSFVVAFSLSCQGKTLRDAILKCNVSTKSSFGRLEPLFSVPVATNSQGVYSTSWILPQLQPSTDYLLQCYREIDRLRAIETKEYKEKKKRRELGEDQAGTVEEEPLVLNPFFEITVNHKANDSFKLPIRTEVLITSLLAAAFVAVYFKMTTYTTAK